KDQEAWFSDGNIDIIAQGTAFRVHRGVLTIHSELFRDMLSIPQPTDAGDAGHIPVVEVTDSADNMRHLLLALYYNNSLSHFKPYTQAEFAVVSSLARIAHKYQVKNVLDEAMSRIKAVYPDNLDDFLEVLNERPPDLPMRSKDIDSLHVLQIARLVGDTSLLRPAFYRLCQL
ncbi:uncharacterized protein B0H18DRAFT_845962, partial [Fomitopsis serialis]|uniref:uncharacterized protein n=1 Tax=Fomitopsis serialis TaxID=139415 RepID=UPI002007974A